MSSRHLPAGGVTVRSRPMAVLVAVVGAIAAAAVVLSAVQDPAALLHWGPPAAFGIALAWCLLAMPSVRLEEDDITVVNPFRTHRLHYADLVDVDTRFGLRLITRHRRIQAAGAPSGGAGTHLRARRDDIDGFVEHTMVGQVRTIGDEGPSARASDLGNAPAGRAARAIRDHWQEQIETGTLKGEEAEPVSTTNTGVLLVLAVLAAAAVLALVL